MSSNDWLQPDLEIDETGAWLSIGDLMSGLLMIFALLLVVAMLQLTEAAEKARDSRVVIIQAIHETLAANGINAEINPETGDISILDSVLFDQNQYKLKPEGIEFMNVFVPIYSKAIFSSTDVADEIVYVVIEGHTSSAGNDDHNMHLSLLRSNSVSSAIAQMEFSQKEQFMNRLLVAGRGELEASQLEDLSSDRKVNFRFQFKSERFLHWFLNKQGL